MTEPLKLERVDIAGWEREQARRCALPLTDPQHPQGFRFDRQHNTLDLYWAGYEYWIALDRINTPTKLLGFLHHLSGKTWTTRERLGSLIEAVAAEHGWPIHSW